MSITGRRPVELRYRLARWINDGASYLILGCFSLIVLYPIVWMVLASFKSEGELVTNVWGLPRQLGIQNYVAAWQSAHLATSIANSLVVSFSAVTLILFLGSLAGFALARFNFRGATAILLLFVLTMQTPAPLIPLFVVLVKTKLTDTYLGLILPLVSNGLPLSIFIFRTFFLGVPREILDAAKVDGCNEFGTYLRVVLPISGPVISAVAILQFINSWNEYTIPLIAVRQVAMRTLPLSIQVFFGDYGGVEWVQLLAAMSLSSVPLLIIFIIMQRQFIAGLTSGALKG